MTIATYIMVALRRFVVVSKSMTIGGNPYSYFFGMVSNLTLGKKVSKVK